MIHITTVEDPEELEAALLIRRRVFIEEQKVPPGEEIDGKDDEAVHFLLYQDDEPAAAGRLRMENDEARLERIAVLKPNRGKGLGEELTRFMIEYATESRAGKIVTSSQLPVVGFYERLGFVAVGETYMDAGIEHVRMVLIATGSGGLSGTPKPQSPQE